MGHIAVYDAKKVSVIIDGQFITGFAESTFVSASKDEDSIEPSVSAQGDVGIAVRHNTLGTIEVTLNQTSPSINMLDSLAASSKMISAWVVSNNEVKEKSGGTKAMITKPSDKEYGDTISERTYEIKVFDYISE